MVIANPFIPATKDQSRARIALIGAPGSGKTWMALETATRLAELRGGSIALIDTEGRSARKYADMFEFDVLDLSGDYSPNQYINAIKAAAENGYAVLVIDSLSHAWNGSNGVLEIVDRAGEKMGGNDFAGWSAGRPAQNKLMNAIINADIDVIATLRAKVEWSLEKNSKTGKTEPVPIGTKAIQADGIEHEFDLALLVDMQHVMTVRKTRNRTFPTGEAIPDTHILADGMYAWLTTGTTLTVRRYLQTPEGKAALRDLLKELSITDYAPYLKALELQKAFSEYTGTFKDMESTIRETYRSLSSAAQESDTTPDEPATQSVSTNEEDADTNKQHEDEPVKRYDVTVKQVQYIGDDEIKLTTEKHGDVKFDRAWLKQQLCTGSITNRHPGEQWWKKYQVDSWTSNSVFGTTYRCPDLSIEYLVQGGEVDVVRAWVTVKDEPTTAPGVRPADEMTDEEKARAEKELAAME